MAEEAVGDFAADDDGALASAAFVVPAVEDAHCAGLVGDGAAGAAAVGGLAGGADGEVVAAVEVDVAEQGERLADAGVGAAGVEGVGGVAEHADAAIGGGRAAIDDLEAVEAAAAGEEVVAAVVVEVDGGDAGEVGVVVAGSIEDVVGPGRGDGLVAAAVDVDGALAAGAGAVAVDGVGVGGQVGVALFGLGRDEDVGDAVAVEVAAGDVESEAVVGRVAGVADEGGGGFAGVAGLGAAIQVGDAGVELVGQGGRGGADDEVAEAVAVDVADRRDREAVLGASGGAGQVEGAGAGVGAGDEEGAADVDAER